MGAEDLALAHRLADEAARVAMRHVRGLSTSRTKSDGSIVTDADEAVEDALRAMLAAERPADGVLGEERGRTGHGSRTWILDPIDGTRSFAEGGTEWGCLIALQIGAEVVIGIVEQPTQRVRYWAARGRGAHQRTAAGTTLPLAVDAGAVDLSSARAVLPTREWPRTGRADVIAGVMATLVGVPPTNHPAVQVAEGAADAAVLVGGGPWDLAAPALIVEEAGGRFSDLDGSPSLDSGAGLFTNGRIHDPLLQRFRRPR